MATIKVKFRPSSVTDSEGTIYYQVIHNRKVRQIHSGYKVYVSEWDAESSTVCHGAVPGREEYIRLVRHAIRRDMERLNRILRRLDNACIDVTVDEIVDEFHHYMEQYSVGTFMEEIISKLKSARRTRTSEIYTATLRSFTRFCSELEQQRHWPLETPMMLDMLDSNVMESYEAWLKYRGNCLNTISFYIRVLRAVYNRAVDEGVIDDCRPFRHVYTGIGRTVKRALPLGIVSRLKNQDLTGEPALDYARDMFMMSFYLRGMSLIDMAFLHKKQLCGGRITYQRRKTGQRLTIQWTKEMSAILRKYGCNKSDYLLPIIRKKGVNERCAYRNAAYRINRNLKKLAGMLGLDISLTLYVARHSWASVARAKGIPLRVISEGMGHGSEVTTRIYLAELDSNVVDRANSLIISSL